VIYCTLAEAKREHKATSTADDNILLSYVRQTTARINRLAVGRSQYAHFGPTIEARTIPISPRTVNSNLNTLKLDRPLLSLSAAVAHLTTVTTLAAGYPQGETPYYLLRINSNGDYWWAYASGCDPVYATITGVWGYHSDYDNAWMAVDALAANINASVTTITIADVDGADQYGLTPRISTGSLLKIGDEFLEVSATDTTADTATVRRGANGSTAAVHSLGDTVYAFQVEEPIRRVVARQAGMMYARRGAYEASRLDGIGQVNYPQDLLRELAAVVSEYQYG
jgi:hypothetical protein